MKNFIRLGLICSLFLGVSNHSQAALLLEPAIGYSFGTLNTETTTAGVKASDDEKIKGVSYGGRVGYQNLGFQLGLDYLASTMSTSENDFNTSEWAGFVGFEFPILIRVYAGYVFSGTGELKGDNDTSEFEGASGPKIGVGFTLLPLLDFNIEYRQVKYDSETVGASKLEADYSAVMVGFSLPFTI